MNLHGIVSRAIGTVNPQIVGEVLVSDSYDTTPDRRQVPRYAPAQQAPMQVQALTTRDLMQLNGVNLQGSAYSVYIGAPVRGLVRPDGKGGDLLRFAWDGKDRTWLVTAVIEAWPDWCKVAAVLQAD